MVNIGKVLNSSDYWTEWNDEIIYYSIYWNKDNSHQLIEKQLEFLTIYSLLTIKYGICITPTNTLNYYEIKDNIEKLLKLSNFKFGEDWIPLNLIQLYKSDSYLESTCLFYGSISDIKSKMLVNAELKLTVSDILNKESEDPNYLRGNFANPLNIEFFKDHISVKFSSNTLFPILKGQKTGWNTRYIDNSDLAYLNGTRFNSFFRDLKTLCFKYGAQKITYDQGYLYYLKDEPVKLNSEDGILFNGEVVYYEDVYTMLPDEHKYKKFEELNYDQINNNDILRNNLLTIQDEKEITYSKSINLKSNANEKHHFTLNIENASKNVFAITHIESENDDMFKEGNWVFILFAGYSGPDIKFIKELIDVADKYPKLNFAFKPYMDDDKMQDFTQVNIQRKRTPVVILKKDNISKLLSDTNKDIEKIKIALNSIE